MKRLLPLAAAAGLLACDAARGAATQFSGETAYQYVLQQVGFGPRIPNTEGHRQTGDWILSRLRATADSVEVQAFEHVTRDGDTLHLRNFIGRFRMDAPGRVLLLAHWDTRPRADQARNLAEQAQPVPGANDGASGVAILLGVADVLAATPPSVGVDLLFVDGEDYGSFTGPDVLIGSRYYAEHRDTTTAPPLFAVLFDMVGDADLEIFQEGNSVQGAPEVVARVWGVAAELGYADVFRSSVRHSITDDHLPLIRAGIRAIDVIDFDYPYWHTTEDTAERVSAASLQIVGDVAVRLVM